MLALVVGVEAFVARHWLDFNDPVSLNWRLSAADAPRKAPGCDVLFVGDSLVKHGLIPRVVEDRSGLRACNLAAARGPSVATYFFLRRALEAGARPEAVVVDFKPGVLFGSPQFNLRYWQEVATPRECYELFRSGGGATFAGGLVLGRLFPSIRGRLEVRSNVLAALRGEYDRLHEMNRTLSRHWADQDGGNLAPRNPAFQGELTPDEVTVYRTNIWYRHAENVAYIHHFFRLAAERGLRVYWLLPPLAPRLQDRRDGSPAEEGYLGLVRRVVRTYPNVTVLDGRHARYPHSVFVDPTHLDRQGALTLSLDVADVLRRDRSGARADRWRELPRYRESLTDIPLEDVEFSKLARAVKEKAR